MDTGRKEDKSNLRKYYTIFVECGLIVALAICLVAMKVNTGHEKKENYHPQKHQETVKMKKVKRTRQTKKPPPPPTPQVPTAVPNDQVLQDQKELHFNSDLDFNQPLPAAPEEQHSGTSTKEKIFQAVEQNPKLKGGLAELQKKVKYPESCRNANIQGRVTLQFVVDKKGIPENVHVIRGIGGGCDKAAIEAVKKYARFTPGRQRGEPVKVRYSLPILFRLKQH
jgi:protein TonB